MSTKVLYLPKNFYTYPKQTSGYAQSPMPRTSILIRHITSFVTQQRLYTASDVGRYEGSGGGGPGEFVISGGLVPHTPTLYEKNLTRFLRFSWTPLGSSGEGRSGPLLPLALANYAVVYSQRLR